VDKNQYATISYVLAASVLTEGEKIEKINETLGIDITDRAAAKTLKEAIIGYATLEIETTSDRTTVTFGDISSTAETFGIAFITCLMMNINSKALDSFLPEPQQPKTASAGKRDGLGSPAPARGLPVRGGNY